MRLLPPSAGPVPARLKPRVPRVPCYLVMKIAIMLAIPRMIVFDAAVRTIPVTFVEEPSIVPGCDPSRADIGRPAPVSVMPNVAPRYRIPISAYPCVTGAGTYRNGNNSRGGGGAYRDS